MSLRQPTTARCTVCNHSEVNFQLPANTLTLLTWLDEQPNFISVERERRVRNVDEFASDAEQTSDRITSTRYGFFTREVTEQQYINPAYEITTRACYGSQQEVCDAWEAMQYPKHNPGSTQGVSGAHLYTWSSTSQPRTRFGRAGRGRGRDADSTINYQAIQHPDGHGVIEHYSTIAAVRTKTGLVINNEQDFGTGFAHITWPEGDHTLPLTGIDNILSDHPETVYDIARIVRDSVEITYQTKRDLIGGHDVVTGVRPSRDADRDVHVAELTTGAAVVLLFDSTANNRDERKCGFYLSSTEWGQMTRPKDALEALRPDKVTESDLPVIPADEYADGGATYGGDQLGSAIIRQGEWYLIPAAEDFTPNAPIKKCLSVPSRYSDWDATPIKDEVPDKFTRTGVDEEVPDLPEHCPMCGADGLEIDARYPVADCSECDHRVVYHEGFLKERAAEALDDWCDDNYGHITSNMRDILDSHVPRDLAVEPDPVKPYVRGSFRHVDNEHQMINLEERWHLVAENTKDVTVFDLGTEGSGVARFE